MVEVFITNVHDAGSADKALELIHKRFAYYIANFDLEDCDKILRVESNQSIDPSALITLMESLGHKARLLPDEIPVFIHEKKQLHESRTIYPG